MKTLTLLLAFSVFAASAQTIRIADNNANRPAGSNIFPTIQAAVDAAVAGDIVFVQPSLTNYGDVTINKQIILRGIGFNTGKDFAMNSILNNISLTNRTDNTSNASGTIIDGVAANSILLGVQSGSFSYTLQNITIQNSSVTTLTRNAGFVNALNVSIVNCITSIRFFISNISQLLIYGCYLTGPTLNAGCLNFTSAYLFGAGSLNSCTISNNIIAASTSNGIFGSSVSVNGLAIVNNNFLAGNDITNSRFISNMACNPAQLYDAVVSNNIFYGCAPNATSGGTFERNSFGNNLTFGTSNNTLPPAGTGAGNTNAGGNKVNQDPLFINAPYNTVYAATMNFNLQPSSPAKNAGSDGTDMGITGGAYPITSGNINLGPTAAPVIMTFTPQVLVPQNQPVKANIKAKAN